MRARSHLGMAWALILPKRMDDGRWTMFGGAFPPIVYRPNSSRTDHFNR